MTFRTLPTREECSARLAMIFPRAAFDPVHANPLAAASVVALIYVGAVAPEQSPVPDDQVWARPSMCLRMSDAVLARNSDQDRTAWREAMLTNTKKKVDDLMAQWGVRAEHWYADNSRETLRDETFTRWLDHGAIRERPGLPTSSSKPRWALASEFADLFAPTLTGPALEQTIEAWRSTHMDPGDRLRIATAQQRDQATHAVRVTMPDGSTRTLEPGTASRILKGVVEQWAPARLHDPVVLTISEPSRKILVADAAVLTRLGLTIDQATLLPDAVLVDIGANPVEFWIIEAVHTDGPISDRRRDDLLKWAEEQRIKPETCHFVTAFESRNSQPARKRLKDLGTGTYAWFLDEPTRELSWHEIAEGPA
ncbi:BsuBI/PstI family type II restriction endonuclease [Kineococcus endophyticus]|uniref:BsuBI/PstI family type II restriction endonuclease n=1 Tax=Kineococcus endophyticus TaxID=1181883 RepID=A0ABV3PCY6_9ACTN